jgi:monovalent cation:H+ antiporter-2, CPA2 family
MEHASILLLVVALLAATVLAVVVCRRLGLPTILAYLSVGIVLGPHALKLIPDSSKASELAEYGVVFLMFSIGLEFSAAKLKSLQSIVLRLALPQVLVTLLLVLLIGWALGLNLLTAFAIASAVAMSSTAIGSKMLTENGELMSEHGRRTIGVLLAQDIAVVPILILLPSMARGENMGTVLALLLIKMAIALALIFKFGPRWMRIWMTLVAARKSPELFILNILLVTLGLAGLSEWAGLSLALGAFLAGMLIADTPYHYQVEEDIKPFRDVLLGLFFVTIGMQLDVAVMLAQLGWVLAVLLSLLLIKASVVMAVMMLDKTNPTNLATQIRTGVYLAQGGEFSFVLVALATSLQLLDGKVMQIVLAALLLSMLVSPLLIQHSEKLVQKLTANDWTMRALDLTRLMSLNLARQDHIVVCGYGRSGQFLTRMLDAENVRWLAYDHDPMRLKEAQSLSQQVLYGDCARREVLAAAGLAKAKALVITFTNTEVAKRIIVAAKSLRADLPIIVRTTDESTVQSLLAAGATEVVPDVVESAIVLGSHALLHVGTPLRKVLQRLRSLRDERYTLFAGFFHGASDAPDSDEAAQRLHTYTLSETASVLGKPINSLSLPALTQVVGLKRGGVKVNLKDADYVLESDDCLIVLGTSDGLDQMERLLR